MADVVLEVAVAVKPIEDRREIAARSENARLDLLPGESKDGSVGGFASKYPAPSPSPRMRHPDNLTRLSAAPLSFTVAHSVTAKVQSRSPLTVKRRVNVINEVLIGSSGHTGASVMPEGKRALSAIPQKVSRVFEHVLQRIRYTLRPTV